MVGRQFEQCTSTHNCDVRDKSAVHDVYVDPVCSSCLNSLDLYQDNPDLSSLL